MGEGIRDMIRGSQGGHCRAWNLMYLLICLLLRKGARGRSRRRHGWVGSGGKEIRTSGFLGLGSLTEGEWPSYAQVTSTTDQLSEHEQVCLL